MPRNLPTGMSALRRRQLRDARVSEPLRFFALDAKPRHDTDTRTDAKRSVSPCMPGSQLERIADWALLAQEARYRASEMARLKQISLRQLERNFLQHFSRPPLDWLDELRLIKAAILLVGGRRVKEVAGALGFSTVSHFSRRFEQYHGCRPVQFVRIHDRRLAHRKRQFAAWFPGEQIPAEWLADPALAKPWDILLQRQRESFT